MEPVTGVEPATSSLQVNTSGYTRLHSSPLTCGNTPNERDYDGLGTAATATELHRFATTDAELLLLRVHDASGGGVTPRTDSNTPGAPAGSA